MGLTWVPSGVVSSVEAALAVPCSLHQVKVEEQEGKVGPHVPGEALHFLIAAFRVKVVLGSRYKYGDIKE